MPADVIWTDLGTEQRQPLRREGEQGGSAGRKGASPASPSSLARGSGFSSSSKLLLHTSPRCSAAPTPHRLGGVCCLPLNQPCHSTAMFSHGVARGGARYNSSLSPRRQPVPSCFSTRYTSLAQNIHIPPVPSPSALSLLLDHQGFMHRDTAETQDVPPSPAVAVLGC